MKVSELTLNEKELLENLLNEFDYILQTKYAESEEIRNKLIERRYNLLKLKLNAFSTVNIDQLEKEYR